MRFTYLVLLGILFSTGAIAQPEVRNTALNQTDKRGQKQGMWFVQQPERMGEDAFTEFGNYNTSRKTGLWYHMNNLGEIIAIEQYRNNVLDGEVKYFENGRLTCIGHYRGLNPDQAFDTIYVEHPVTGAEKLMVIPTDRGTLRHGSWRYYDVATGRLIREEEYQVDELLSRQVFAIANADSAYYAERNKHLPHNTGAKYQPPRGKRVHYLTD